MRKIKILILCILVCMLCGCTSIRSNLYIHRDGSLYFEVSKANSQEVSTSETILLENKINSMADCGYTVTQEKVGSVDILKASINVEHVDNLVGKHDFGTCDNNLFSLKKNNFFVFNLYEFNINTNNENYDMFIEDNYENNNTGFYKFEVFSSYKLLNHNAKFVEDSYIWYPDEMNENIEFKFYLINWVNLIISFISLILIIVIVCKIIKNIQQKKYKKTKKIKEISINME